MKEEGYISKRDDKQVCVRVNWPLWYKIARYSIEAGESRQCFLVKAIEAHVAKYDQTLDEKKRVE